MLRRDPASGRQASLERLRGRRFDLLFIGAGIVGSRVAYEAAHEGLSVALVDAGDYGGRTSSATSKLLHGGLRYLSTGDIGLVRQLQSERHAIATRIAPHLVEPLPLVLAVEGRSPARAAKLAVALPLYAALSGFRRPLPRRVSVDAAVELVAPLRRESVTACGVVTEVLIQDARLTLATVLAAQRAGAVAVNYARVVELERELGRVTAAIVEDVPTGERLRVAFGAVVNAAGPSVDDVRRLEWARAVPLVRLSTGVHVVVPLRGEWRGGLALFDETGTAIAIPWQGMLLIGATDTPYAEGLPAPVVDPADVRQLLGRFADVLPREHLAASSVVHTFAGLRALPIGSVATGRASRRHVVAVGSGGMVSIAGGKLTTHRRIAMDALGHLPVEVRPRRRTPRDDALGQTCPSAAASLLRASLDPDVAMHLIRLYGADAPRVAAYGDQTAGALDRIDPRGPDIWAQVDFARDEEWALAVDDVVARRTTLAVRGLASAPVVEAVRGRLARGDGTLGSTSFGSEAEPQRSLLPL
jgi:glycerol-3-phosphate dehydrogenase